MAGATDSKRDIPKPALILGLAGLIPFFAPALGLWSGDPSLIHNALIMQFGYAAVILSFLGGVHWGRALAGDACTPNWARLIWSVTPATLGWALLLLPDAKVILGGFAVAFALAFLVDRKAVAVGMFPAWYGRLRKLLTIGVLTALILTLAAGYGAIAV
ncbi:DUF3429 domain-containing protein [Pacificispira sp.]|uniref:DUF3429 domain-containing protein n=1 Tax=Pacificispira sp. TaxID=2888761 RepID=UPI003BAB1B4E